MCGIAGFVHLDGRPLLRDAAAPLLAAMGDAIHHRGPDDTRTMVWENVGFVFKRLSIVDVSGGAQPFETDNGQVCAMVNGAIYNHREIRAGLASQARLRSQSDCEVIPHLYLERGLELFAPVNGMFAAALLDRAKRRVLLARDRMGVKPLFYCVADGGRVLVFASELKGLFAHPAVPRRFDWSAALAEKLLGEETMPQECPSGFHGIERVPAASVLDVDLVRGTLATRRYWQLPARETAAEARPASHYVDGYRALLEDSVNLRLMADVRYGLFLSGGLDSTAIAAIAARAGPLPTFSVVSRATMGSGDATAAVEAAAALGLPNHAVAFDEETIDVGPDDWRRILWHCEMPQLTAEQVYKFYLHAYARQRYPDLKVMLLGQGSDEFNGGYMAMLLGREGPWTPDDWHAVGKRLRAVQVDRAAALADFSRTYHDLFHDGVLAPEFACRAAGRPCIGATWDLYVGLFRRNLDYHLWHEDRTAAAHSIENRVPFLDYRLVEFLARAPEVHHAGLFSDKAVLRRAVRSLLPERFAARPKGYFFYGNGERHAFRMMHAILQRNGGELIEQALAASARTDGPLDAEGLRAFARKIGADPDCRDATRLLNLVNMGVLADMVDRQAAFAWTVDRLPVAETALSNSLQPITRKPDADPRELDDDSVLAVPAGHRVVVVGPEDAGTERPGVYVVIGVRMHMIESPTLAKLLVRADGRSTLRQIVAAGRLSGSQARKQARRAVEDGILEVREHLLLRPAPPAAARQRRER